MKIHHIAIAAFAIAACSATAAMAQDLKQDITVEHEVVPERNDVRRLNLSPKVTLATPAVKKLDYSNRAVSITVPPTINPLEPAAWNDSIPTTSWRGYVEGGLFPTLFDADLSAGYKFVDNDHTRFAGFLQYNGSTYKGAFPVDGAPDQYVRRHTATIDMILHQAVGKKSTIDAGFDFGLARYNMPASQGGLFRLGEQNMRRAGAQATWSSQARKFNYTAGLSYNHFGYGNTMLTLPLDRDTYKPVHENIFALKGTLHYALNDKMSSVGAQADLNVVANNRRTDAAYSIPDGRYIYFDRNGTYNHSLLSLKPYYRFDYKRFRLNLGARLDFTFNSGRVVHIAPDVLVSWRPSWLFAIYAKAGGGEHQNTLSSLYGVTPYTATMMAYENSHIPFTFDAGITLGSWRGAYLELGGGYARANDWLMPVTDATGNSIFKGINMRGMHWRIEAGYKYRRLAAISVSYAGAQQGYDKGYYLWHDRAKAVVGARLKVTPIKPLDINVDYELRSGRAMIDYCKSADAMTPAYGMTYSLGNISDLSIGGNYRLTTRFTAFLYLNNLLNHKYRHIGLVPGQGLHGLLGVSYKF